MATDSGKPFKSIFRQVPKWQDLWFYQKTQVLYQMTYVFCERFLPMQDFTKSHNVLSDYEPFFGKWSAEEMANIGLTLCFQVDTMMNKYMESLERTFVTASGIGGTPITLLRADNDEEQQLSDWNVRLHGGFNNKGDAIDADVIDNNAQEPARSHRR